MATSAYFAAVCTVLVLLGAKPHVSHAYSISTSNRNGSIQQPAPPPPPLFSRTAFLQTQGALVASLWMVQPAHAVDDPERALRTVNASLRKLSSSTVAGLVTDSDYPSLQQLLRQPPLSDIRKACSQLAKEDAELQARYKTFIAALEKMDTTAMVAQRGRTIGELELMERYDDVVAALGEFATLAAKGSSAVEV